MMIAVNVRTPILVKQVKMDEQPHFQIRPLFTNYPIITNRRFEKGLQKFKSEVKNMFRGKKIDTSLRQQLLWYKFNPELQYESIKVHLPAKLGGLARQFPFIKFELQGNTFVLFPSFSNEKLLVDKGSRKNFQEQVEAKILALIKEEQDFEVGDFDIENYIFKKDEFISEVESFVHVDIADFSFQQEENDWFFYNMNSQEEFVGSLELERVGHDYNDLFPNELKRAYLREKVVDHLYNLMYNGANTPLVIIGDDGVGRHSIVEETVYRYCEAFENKNAEHLEKLHYVNPNRIISGMSIVGQWQKRTESILKYVAERRLEIKAIKDKRTDKVLIDNVLSLLSIGKSAQNNMTLSDLVQTHLEKKKFQLVVIARPEEWKIVQEKKRRFADLFQVIRINEPGALDAAKMVLRQRIEVESQLGTSISAHAVKQLFAIHRNFFKRNALPGSVMKMMKQVAVRYPNQLIDADEVRKYFQQSSGLDNDLFDRSVQYKLGEIESRLSSHLIGQEDAVNALTDTIHTIKAKLNNPNKPFGSLLFIGPTGVGKTQAAKVLCQFLLGNEKKMIRLDMNEYIDGTAVQRLIGSSHQPEGVLTSKVRHQPFGVLLFDEIEKAHPDVHDLLLQVLDDGRLTDSRGQLVDFTNTIIILTSNVGAVDINRSISFDKTGRNDEAIYHKALQNKFRPEFLNRIEKTVVFQPLQREHIFNIAKLQIQDLLQRDGFVRRTTLLNIDPDALKWVAQRGYDGKMGGRALKRQIEKDLTNLTADQLVRTNASRPIILNIHLKDGQLFPAIHPLDFIEPLDFKMPEIPNEREGRRFYNQLIKRIEYIERRISNRNDEDEDGFIVIPSSDDDSKDWLFYQFKDRLVEMKNQLNTIALGFREKYFREAPAIPLRLKGGGLASFIHRQDNSNRAVREIIRDRLFQKEALSELSDFYRYSEAQFDSLKTEFLKHLVEVDLTEIYAQGVYKEQTETLHFQLKSCVQDQGHDEVQYLSSLYEQLFNHMDIPFTNETFGNYTLDGYNLYSIFKNEQGIHLFNLPNRPAIPIQMQLEGGKEQFEVIRIYDDLTLTDIRTGWSNAKDITSEELQFLVWSGTLDSGV